ncbi:MAG: methyltransferase domain-containing protein [Proteobacteria bacterium]|nr:methyltransferase domain-containing protein [Pseudomonadota bacterium]MBU4011353.1 methyltransferase domain-containing protein [Pseudomonadota bacterium]
MGHIFNLKDFTEYNKWLEKPCNRSVCSLEKKLMTDMLQPAKGETIIDIGCGTGESLTPYIEMGLSVTGIDPSKHMLDYAIKELGNRAEFRLCFAEDLPFDDNSFNYASFFTSLEFVDNPRKALEEACRVAKDKLFIGILNSYSINVFNIRIKKHFSETVYRHARFFNIWKIKKMIKELLGDVPVSWETAYELPFEYCSIANKLGKTDFAKKCPFGPFVGIVIPLIPRFRTKPLTIKYSAKQTSHAITGNPVLGGSINGSPSL